VRSNLAELSHAIYDLEDTGAGVGRRGESICPASDQDTFISRVGALICFGSMKCGFCASFKPLAIDNSKPK
jgi:hypothetical protein